MHIPYELSDEFPDETVLIARLAKINYLIQAKASRYDAVNGQIFRIQSEENLPPMRSWKISRRSASSLKTRSPACSPGPNVNVK